MYGIVARNTLLSIGIAGATLGFRLAQADEPAQSRTDSVGIRLILLPAGKFAMGMEETIAEAEKVYGQRARDFGGELPSHSVHITRPFYLGKFEVTVGQFAEFVTVTGYRTAAEIRSNGSGLEIVDNRVVGAHAADATLNSAFRTGAQYSWRHPGFPQTGDHPVVNVNWADAEAFCRWLSERETATYRLPSEAEWEYACRAGTKTRYSNGNDPAAVTKVANIGDRAAAKLFPHWAKQAVASDDGFGYTAPVGSFRPNAWGLCDLHGNVWEWCRDTAFRRYPRTGETLRDPVHTAAGPYRVVRGGCWTKWTTHCRSAKRYRNPAEKPSLNVGFRVVREMAE